LQRHLTTLRSLLSHKEVITSRPSFKGMKYWHGGYPSLLTMEPV